MKLSIIKRIPESFITKYSVSAEDAETFLRQYKTAENRMAAKMP